MTLSFTGCSLPPAKPAPAASTGAATDTVDRNPQTFADNIMYAKPEAFTRATQRVYRSGTELSAVALPVVTRQ